MPRRVYTQSHADYIVETFAEIAAAPERLKGYRIIWEPPALRHFTAHFEPLIRFVSGAVARPGASIRCGT